MSFRQYYVCVCRYFNWCRFVSRFFRVSRVAVSLIKKSVRSVYRKKNKKHFRGAHFEMLKYTLNYVIQSELSQGDQESLNI